VSESSPKKPPIAQTPATTGLAGSDEESSVAGATAEAVIHVDDNMRTGVQRAKRYGKGNNPSKHPSRQYGLLGDQENNEMDSGVAAPVESSPGNKALKSRHRSRKRTSISKPTYPCPICKIEYPTGYYRDKHYRNKRKSLSRLVGRFR
jgi:hypothetical protein